MERAVLIPLIVACALFMENMDSTVLATSLPAIAADIGENPLALKLALTVLPGRASPSSFPISGWVADRYGSSTVFAAAIGVFMADRSLCAASSSLHALRHRAIPAGHRRGDDGAGRAPRAAALGAEKRATSPRSAT